MAVRNEEEFEKLVSDVTIKAYRRVKAKVAENAERIADDIVNLGWGCGCCADPQDELRRAVVALIKLEEKE